MTEEELAALEERLAEAEAEVERLQTTAADREARAAHLDETLGEAKAHLASRDAELAALSDEVAAARSEAEELRGGPRAGAGEERPAGAHRRACAADAGHRRPDPDGEDQLRPGTKEVAADL